jgi:hypothetical protein
MVGPTAAVAALSIVIALAAGPLYDFTVRTADELLDPADYTEEVIDP